MHAHLFQVCDLMDSSPPGFSSHGIFQVRILSGLPFPSPGNLSDQGLNLGLLHWQADSLLPELQGKPPNNLSQAPIQHQNPLYTIPGTTSLLYLNIPGKQEGHHSSGATGTYLLSVQAVLRIFHCAFTAITTLNEYYRYYHFEHLFLINLC